MEDPANTSVEMWIGRPKLILASSSPRRRVLLESVGALAEVRIPGIAESIEVTECPDELARRLSRAKAEPVADGLSRGIVLGADTLVVLDGELMGKPRSRDEARSMLTRLGGRTHQVVTGITLVDAETGRSVSAHATTDVTFRPISEAEINAYLETGEPFDKAGAYGAQGRAGLFISSVNGCFYNVVGLPLALLVATLDELLGNASG
ncbi:MAG: septum formation protein Maf [Candidatus Eisenbacteria sp.]|nr:septum formation protein Maf [Candidatus Eisenbacteria bacterium]